jgi:hypothetical protein
MLSVTTPLHEGLDLQDLQMEDEEVTHLADVVGDKTLSLSPECTAQRLEVMSGEERQLWPCRGRQMAQI